MPGRLAAYLVAAATLAAARLIAGGCAILAGVGLWLGFSGRWHGFIAAALWAVVGAPAFHFLWVENGRRPDPYTTRRPAPDRRH